MADDLTPERLAEIDKHLDRASAVVTEMDNYGLMANTHWIRPLVHGLLAADKLRAELERLREELAEYRTANTRMQEINTRLAGRAEQAEAERDALKAADERVRAAAADWKTRARKADARASTELRHVDVIVRENAWATAYGSLAAEVLAALATPTEGATDE